MKKISAILACLILFSLQTFAQNETLHGDDAIKQLQQTGQYDSLIQAVKDSRNKNGQTDEPSIEDAVGQSAKLTASDGAANDLFGTSIAISGDTAIVGAPQDDVGVNANQGSAYVFVRNGTAWTQQAQLTAMGGAAQDFFGISVSIKSETAIVGAYADDVSVNTNQGSAYVFVRSGGVWSQQQQLTASDGAADDLLGISVSIIGDTAIVGSYGDDVSANVNQGSAYIFVRSGVVWTQQQKLTASDGATDDNFGNSVSISGDTAIVGANLHNVGANANQGSAYVFVRSGGVWTQQAQLFATGGAAQDFFGFSVAISGDSVVIGAYGDDVGAISEQGSAYVFVRSGVVWTQQAQLTSTGGATFDLFGYSVAIDGNTVIVGAYDDDVEINIGQGAAYVFTRSGAVWTQQPQLLATSDVGGDQFGWSVAISGNNMLIGAREDNIGGNGSQGSAYIFRNLGSTWIQEAQKVASDGAANDLFGYSVSISGDTAIVGAYSNDVGANPSQGSAYVFVRNGTVWTEQQQITASDGAANDQFGFIVAISGDTAIVGANFDAVGANNFQGSAYIFVRSGVVWTEQQKLTASDGAAGDTFGNSVSIDGDTAVVGANLDFVGANPAQGSAYVFVRNGTVWSQQQKLIATSGAAVDQFGWSVAISGDKIIVGAPTSNASVNVPLAPNAASQGAVFVFINNLIPSAAGVSLGGRILTADGNGVRNAIVSVTLPNGEVRTTRSSSFGYYRFDDLESGQTIVISVNSKRFSFTPQVVTLSDSISELNFTAQ